MHPPLEQLLAAPDFTAGETHKHLETCLRCRMDVESVRQMQDRLVSLPQLEPPAASWTNIQVALQSSARASKSRTLYIAVAAGVAALAVLSFRLLTIEEEAIEETRTAGATALSEGVQASEGITALREQSRHLDLVLQGLPNRPLVERVAMTATLDSIEGRIQWLDMQLSYASVAETDELQTQTLWRERVQLMDSLVKVRYAQAGRASF